LTLHQLSKGGFLKDFRGKSQKTAFPTKKIGFLDQFLSGIGNKIRLYLTFRAEIKPFFTL